MPPTVQVASAPGASPTGQNITINTSTGTEKRRGGRLIDTTLARQHTEVYQFTNVDGPLEWQVKCRGTPIYEHTIRLACAKPR